MKKFIREMYENYLEKRFISFAKGIQDYCNSQVNELNANHIRKFLFDTITLNSNESEEHLTRVSGITHILATDLSTHNPELNFDQNQINMLTQASVLHDIGKIVIPKRILNKKRKLNSIEQEAIKSHSDYGSRMIKELTPVFSPDFKKICYEITRYHHEKYDGRGYPDRLIGEEIPISAQIVSLADILDALTHRRAYKGPYPFDVAVKMIKSGECGHFSERMIASLDRSLDEIGALLKVRK